MPFVFIKRDKFILEQEIRIKEETIRQQNSEVQVGTHRNTAQI